jgi:hypothetical protein
VTVRGVDRWIRGHPILWTGIFGFIVAVAWIASSASLVMLPVIGIAGALFALLVRYLRLSAAQQPAGWYTDPGNAQRLRWWDGRAWTDQLRPIP